MEATALGVKLGMVNPCWDTSSVVDWTDPAYEAFLERLVEARTSAGLTQNSVAKQLGEHQSFVSNCESGERRVDAELGH